MSARAAHHNAAQSSAIATATSSRNDATTTTTALPPSYSAAASATPRLPPLPKEYQTQAESIAGKPWLSNAERDILVLSVLLKALLFPAYRSTDFEVHRNWLAITHSLPLSKWYFDTTSEWTLDYPPLFAYFERFLASFAYLVDPLIVSLDNLDYSATTAVAFQRCTVIATELVLATALLKWAKTSTAPDYTTALVLAASVLLHPALLIVDHIHFQYNGFLLGVLLWSLLAARDGQTYLCAALFAILVNLKHIFVYLAPPFAVFLIRNHCFSRQSGRFLPDRLVELAVLGIVIEAVSFGPFVLAGGFAQVSQIVSRLFPFERGLNHAYWAANFWALYSAADRVLVKYLVRRGWPISEEALTSASRGLVTTTHFGVLPTVTPRMTFSIVLFLSTVFGLKLLLKPTYRAFLTAVTLSAMTSFLFGWHVHEKAVLLFLVPLTLSATDDENAFRSFMLSSTAGIVGLFPLLIRTAETPLKLVFSAAWIAIVMSYLTRVVYKPLPTLGTFVVHTLENAYLVGFVLLQLYVSIGHGLIFGGGASTANASPTKRIADMVVEAVSSAGSSATGSAGRMEFLPLLLTSVYCSIGIVWSYVRLSTAFLLS